MKYHSSDLIIHIGAPKTGSSHIQRFLFENRAHLSDLGLLYPEVSLRGFGHHDYAFLIAGGFPEWATTSDATLKELEHQLTNQCNNHHGPVFLSSENFYLFPSPKQLLTSLQRCGLDESRRIRIMLYLRRQDDAQESWYNQRVKAQGYGGEISNSILESHELWDYAKNLAQWEKYFGRDSIVLKIYEPPLINGENLIKDFLADFGISENELVWPQARQNTRINADIISLQRLINRLPLSPEESRRFHKPLIELTRRSVDKGLFFDGPLLNEEQREQIMENFSSSNKKVSQQYLNCEHLFSEPSQWAGETKGYSGLEQEKWCKSYCG